MSSPFAREGIGRDGGVVRAIGFCARGIEASAHSSGSSKGALQTFVHIGCGHCAGTTIRQHILVAGDCLDVGEFASLIAATALVDEDLGIAAATGEGTGCGLGLAVIT